MTSARVIGEARITLLVVGVGEKSLGVSIPLSSDFVCPTAPASVLNSATLDMTNSNTTRTLTARIENSCFTLPPPPVLIHPANGGTSYRDGWESIK